MFKPLNNAMHWSRQALQKIKAWEDALEYSFESYALDRFRQLEARIAALERKASN